MDTLLLHLLPTEQARCREIARNYTTLGSIGCFAAALIEQALQRADRAIIEGREDAIRSVLHELQAFATKWEPPQRLPLADQPDLGAPRFAIPPGVRSAGRIAHAGAI